MQTNTKDKYKDFFDFIYKEFSPEDLKSAEKILRLFIIFKKNYFQEWQNKIDDRFIYDLLPFVRRVFVLRRL